ncbi:MULTISPECIES: serine/threonine-protein kinase [Trichocoleus]|uniref:non-specific serine/threonine protein kinase n=1 Tax=Trichocoleus desertorum GB2-A4 TaxID=2933944 RepID=A0ABV0JCY8_9CYAN|nr:serine/threonine-protein kinase [Trichocoleus sp. FACHB-46]MBD1860934.1 protein kinase [Trichocoleus sp. FACHB-46]
MPLYCSQRHENPDSSRFCHLCGEKLQAPVSVGVYAGLLLGDRYRVVRELGHGGFGRTYLAEDQNRFNEPCVLKEFAPQVQGTYALQKAEELFEREAGILYKLQHPQIPRFRELFRAALPDRSRLFLVQDYVEGQTYRALLDTRKLQGQRFNEAEVTQLLLQILPILDYIHSLGVIHRDISPDNLILRSADWLPVLIDFGGVKQIAATVASQFLAQSVGNGVSSPTRLGKIGYAPDEQLQMGVASPHSDLYALAVTILVLLTGKEPPDLLDSYNMSWIWRQEVSLSPKLSAILDRMLAQRPSDRYQSVREVLHDLNRYDVPVYAPPAPAPVYPPPVQTTAATVAVGRPPAPPEAAVSNYTVAPPPAYAPPSRGNSFGFGKVLLLLLVMAGAATGGWWLSSNWLGDLADRTPSAPPNEQPVVVPNVEPPAAPELSQEEQNRKEALGDRRRNLGVDYQFFVRLVNQVFYAQHSELQNRQLSAGAEDADLRAQWDQTANQLLDQLETISSEARSEMGKYDRNDRDRWRGSVNKLNLSTRALYTLADAKFFQLFPDQQGQDFVNQPIGQVWHAIAADELKAVQAGTSLEKVQFAQGSFSQEVSGALAPGEGKAFIAQLSQNQLIRLSLQADQKTLLSIYPPTSSQPPLLENSPETTWSGKLAQDGYYEFVVVSAATAPVTFQLNLAADNVISTPPSPVSPPPSPSPSPDSEPTPPAP